MIQKIIDSTALLGSHQSSSHIPDLTVLDCEDAVALDRKTEARTLVSEFLSQPNGGPFRMLREQLHRLLVVRINSVDSGFAEADLNAILSAAIQSAESSGGHWPGPDLWCLPKVESIDELNWLADAIETKLDHAFALQQRPALGLIAMIESCTAVLNLPGICKASRSLKVPLQCVVFGSDDYCVSLGVERSNENTELSYARQFIPVVARAFGLSSIDMVDIDYKDMDRLTVNCRRGAQLGFTGKQTIHPAQLPVVNSSFAPSPARIEWSKALLAEAATHSVSNDGVGAGAFSFRGRMIDRPTLRQARYIIEMSQLLNLQVNSS